MVQLIGIPRPVNYFCPPASHAHTRTNPPLPRHPLLKGPMNTLRSRRQTLEASWNFNTAGFLSESDSKCYLNMSISYACACTQRCSVSTRTSPANVSGISSKNLNQASDEKRDLAGQCFPSTSFSDAPFQGLVSKNWHAPSKKRRNWYQSKSHTSEIASEVNASPLMQVWHNITHYYTYCTQYCKVIIGLPHVKEI